MNQVPFAQCPKSEKSWVSSGSIRLRSGMHSVAIGRLQAASPSDHETTSDLGGASLW